MPQTISTEYLTQLFNAIHEQRQTGLLRVEQVGRGVNKLGEIYFESGRIFNARVGDERGKSALKRISEWEHAIYTFQRIDKPPQSHNLPEVKQYVEAQENESIEPRVSALALLLQRPAASQMHSVTRSSRPFPTKKLQYVPSTFVTETPQIPSDEQPLEPAPLTRIKTALPPARMSQQLILRGETLEAYVPAPPASMSPASQRWTTHLHAEAKTRGMPRKSPATPRPNSQSWENGAQPGRVAIFKTRITITSTQAMQSMERRERIVFVLLDGKRTVQHIAHLLHQSESEVGHVLLKLVKMGFAEYVKG